MNVTVISYAIYLTIALPLTMWVARNLFRNGRIFLVDCFHGDESLADSVNQLLVTGLPVGVSRFATAGEKSGLSLVRKPSDDFPVLHRARGFSTCRCSRFHPADDLCGLCL